MPSEFVSDGLSSYKQAHEQEYAAKNPQDTHSMHISDAGLAKKHNNNHIERSNGTFRVCYRQRRGVKSDKSPLFTGFAIYYNFIRPHMGLGGSTPAEAAGIKIHGTDKWRTLLNCAALSALQACR